MKTIIRFALLVILFFPKNGFSQDYIPLIDTSLEWVGCFHYYKNGSSTGAPIRYRFLNNDTVFNNDTFKVVTAYTIVDTFIMGGIREDTTERKVYGFYAGDSSAYLMYDFSFPSPTPEDTLWIDKNDPDSKYKVNVQSFHDFFGKERTITRLCCDYRFYNTIKYDGVDEVIWIEGLGSDAGLLNNVIINKLPKFKYPNTPVKDKHFLGTRIVRQLATGNILQYFGCEKFDTLAISVEKIKEELSGIQISYVTTNIISVKSSSEMSKISLFSIDGLQVLELNDINTQEYILDLSSINNGWYMVMIQTRDGFIYWKKITRL
jgi:hypothetical protein